MKRIIALALVLVSVLSLIACTGSKEVVLDIDAVAKKLASLPYVEKLEPLDPAVVTTLYAFTSGAEKVVAYGASGATPEELIVAEYADEAAADTAMAKYEARVASQKETFDSYNAEYRPLLDDYLLRRVGKYIVYCVSDDAKAASAALDEFLG